MKHKLKRLAVVATSVFATACTPVQIATFESYTGVDLNPGAEQALFALEDAPITLRDVIIHTDGSIVENPTWGKCPAYNNLLIQYAPPSGWDVTKMDSIMYRESNCQAGVRSRTSDSGLMQINDINHKYLRTALGEWVDRWTLLDPVQNIRAAAALCTYYVNNGRSCYKPWA